MAAGFGDWLEPEAKADMDTRLNRRRSDALHTVGRTLALLACFTPARPEWTVTELARELGLAKSAVSRMVSTLRRHGWIVRDADGRRLRLGLRVLELARAAQTAFALHRAALPVMRALAAETGESVFLTVVDGDEAVTLERVLAGQWLRYSLDVGARSPLHAGASNRVLLAYMPEDEREAYLARPLARFTEQTITDPDRLRAVLRRIREQGYDCSTGELTPGVTAVAAPILTREGRLLGAISIAGPEGRFGPEVLPGHVERVVRAARALAESL